MDFYCCFCINSGALGPMPHFHSGFKILTFLYFNLIIIYVLLHQYCIIDVIIHQLLSLIFFHKDCCLVTSRYIRIELWWGNCCLGSVTDYPSNTVDLLLSVVMQQDELQGWCWTLGMGSPMRYLFMKVLQCPTPLCALT